jgi:hypothetical protein
MGQDTLWGQRSACTCDILLIIVLLHVIPSKNNKSDRTLNPIGHSKSRVWFWYSWFWVSDRI